MRKAVFLFDQVVLGQRTDVARTHQVPAVARVDLQLLPGLHIVQIDTDVLQAQVHRSDAGHAHTRADVDLFCNAYAGVVE